MMKKILCGIAAILLIASTGYCQVAAERTPFSKMEKKGNLIRVQFPAQGIRWKLSLNGSPRGLSGYGEMIELKMGDKLELMERHKQMIVEPQKKGEDYFLLIDSTFDARSSGGEVKHETYLVPVQNVASEPENSGLTLTITSEKPVYEEGETINIDLAIKNAGTGEARIYSPAFWDVSKVVVLNSQGVSVKPKKVMADIRLGAPLVTIPPGQSQEYTYRNLQWNSLDGFWCFCEESKLGPDKYSLYVTITNPPKRVGAKYLSTSLAGTLISNTITFEVVEKKK